jgi:hypothetical protein
VQGDLDGAARLVGYSDASVTRIGYSREYMQRSVYERLFAQLHDHVAPDELARRTTAGASLTPEAAIALALEMNAGTLATQPQPRNIRINAASSDASGRLSSDESGVTAALAH